MKIDTISWLGERIYVTDNNDNSYISLDSDDLILEVEDCGYSEITDIMEQSNGFVELAIANASDRLRAVLNDYFDSYPGEFETYFLSFSQLKSAIIKAVKITTRCNHSLLEQLHSDVDTELAEAKVIESIDALEVLAQILRKINK